jgi:Fe-Mn family superoxide dismutase
MEITRRTILAAGAATAAAAVFPRPHVARAALPLSQPALPFAEADLAPVISAKTVGLHYGKHHKAYYDKLNTLAAGTRYADMELDRIVVESARSKEAADVKIFNNAAQAWNHVAYWDQFVPAAPTVRRAILPPQSTRRLAVMTASSSAPSMSRTPCSAPAGCG